MNIETAQIIINKWVNKKQENLDALVSYTRAVVELEKTGQRFLCDYGVSNVNDPSRTPQFLLDLISPDDLDT